jgi:hypothetical protein
MKANTNPLTHANAAQTVDPSAPSAQPTVVSRRQFLQAGATVTLSLAAFGPGAGRLAAASAPVPDMRLGARELVVQPVLMYRLPQRQPGRSWRPWTGLQSEEAVKQEVERIERELKTLSGAAGFPLHILPVAKVTQASEAAALKGGAFDVLVLYAASAWLDEINTLAGLGKWTIIFVRYQSGPYYYWHEGIHDRFLRAHTDQFQQPSVGVEDVVVDENKDILWRLQALYGLKNVLGRRVVCVGGPSGWECPKAPALARERFQLDLVTVPIPEINAMVEAGRKDEQVMTRCRQEARAYISARGVKLHITEQAVTEAFLLTQLYGDLLTKHGAFAIASTACMNSYAGIMPCMTHTLINDSGRMAYCEGDFVNIPSGILLHYISGKPTYFCNPTFPAHGRMMFAHCTAPRRMDGKNLDPVDLVTHYESDHGAATHVHFRKGQLLTVIKPDFEAKNWLALTGKTLATPFLDTCRAQIELALDADTQDVVKNLRGFHCMLAYGDYVREVVYAAKKVGINVQTLPKARA